MKEITGKQKRKWNLLPQEIKVDKTIIQNPQDIIKEFNKFFTSVESKFTQKNPQHWKKIQEFLTSHNEKMQFEDLNFDEFNKEYFLIV